MLNFDKQTVGGIEMMQFEIDHNKTACQFVDTYFHKNELIPVGKSFHDGELEKNVVDLAYDGEENIVDQACDVERLGQAAFVETDDDALQIEALQSVQKAGVETLNMKTADMFDLRMCLFVRDEHFEHYAATNL